MIRDSSLVPRVKQRSLAVFGVTAPRLQSPTTTDLGDFTSCTLADIPGLIEGASEGKGLGHEFLRHVERTRVILHLLDGAAADPLQDWAMINQELGEPFRRDAMTKPNVVAGIDPADMRPQQV